MELYYESALKEAEMKVFNNNNWYNFLEYLESVLNELERFRRFKRLNQTHLKEIDKALEDKQVYVSLNPCENSFGENEHKFTIYYPQARWERYKEGPSIKRGNHPIKVLSSDLSVEAIYNALKVNIERIKKSAIQKEATLEEYKAFYVELKELMEKHTISSDAIYIITH